MSGEMSQQNAHFAPDGQPVAAVLEHVGEAVALLDRNWRFIYLNRAAERLLQRTRDQLLGKDLWQEYPQGVGSIFDLELRRALEHDTEVGFEEFCPVLGRWLKVLAYPSPSGLSAHIQDITAQRQMQSQCYRYQQELRALEDDAPDVVARFDRECRCLYVNRRVEQLTGRPPEQLVGKSNREGFLPPAASDLWEAKLRQAMGQRRELQFQFDAPTVTGRRHFQARLVPEFGPDGAVESVLSIARDITDWKHAHDAAHERGQQLQAIFDNASAAMYIKDPQGHYLSINRHLEQMLQKSRAQVVGRTDFELLPGDLAQLMHAHDQAAMAARGPVQFEETVLCHGIARTYLSVRFPLFDAEEHLYALCGMCTDITEHKRMAELEAARQAAETANAAKDEMLAVLSHELRNPLTPVLMLASVLEQRSDLPGDLRESLSIIRRNAELEARLIGDLLDVTRIRRGKLEIRPETIDAHVNLRQALEMLQSDIAAKHLNLAVHLKAQHAHVHADPARLQQVFWNVVGNAVKFTPAGGRITIQTSQPQPGLLRIVITDTGIGIEPQALSRIFQAFEQAEPAITRSFGGLGLGLAISKALMQMQGGNITAYSEGAGKGSIFTLELPTVPEKPAEVTASPQPHAPIAGLRILLVEDHPSTAQVMNQLLSRLGHRVYVADNLRHALELARQQRLDLLIADLALPDGSGLDLMRQIRSTYPVKGISLSGYGRAEDVAASKAAGFAVHLTKPIDLPRLMDAIERVSR